MTYKIGDKIENRSTGRCITITNLNTRNWSGEDSYGDDTGRWAVSKHLARLVEARPVDEGDRVRRTFNNGTIVEGVIDRFDVVEDTVIGFSAQEPEIPLWNHRHPEQTEVLERAPKLPANDVVAVIVDGVLLVRDIYDLEEWRYRDGLRVPRDYSDLYRKMLRGEYKAVVTDSNY